MNSDASERILKVAGWDRVVAMTRIGKLLPVSGAILSSTQRSAFVCGVQFHTSEFHV